MFDRQTVEMLLTGVWDTLYMTVAATLFSYVFGMVMGVVLVICRKDGIRPHALVYTSRCLSIGSRCSRSQKHSRGWHC